MEIRRWQIYIVFNCVLIAHLAAKSVSLNELIAAESKQNQDKIQRPKSTDTVSTSKPFSPKEVSPAESRQNVKKTRSPKLSAKTSRRQSFSLRDLFATEAKQTKRKIESLLSKTSGGGLLSHRKRFLPSFSLNNLESRESLFPRAKTLTPFKNRKRFEIKSPLRPKRLKYSFKPRYNRNKQSIKREIFENEKINQKYNYIPLIKRLGVLVDDILSSGSGESFEYSSVERPTPRRNRQKQSENRKDSKCKCDTRLHSGSAESKPYKKVKKAVVPPTTVTTEITNDTEDTPTEAPTTAAYHTTARDVYTVKPDPNLSLLFTRNSTSPRRDYHGFSERSSPTLHGDLERNITRNNGNDQYYSRRERNQTCSPVNTENSCGSTRDDAGGDGSISRLHRARSRHPDSRYEAEETDEISNKPDRFIRRNNEDNEEKDEFQTGRTAKEIPLPGDIRRLRGFLPEHKIDTDAVSVQPKKNGEKSILNVTHDSTSAERIAQRNGAVATEDQRLRQAVETVTPINNLMKQDFSKTNSQPNQVVTIFDGYSVARDINGRNKLSEKSIRISS